VLHGHKPFSDKLARQLQETLGIRFDDLPRGKRVAPRRRERAKAAKTS
jgi:hypothetical protein